MALKKRFSEAARYESERVVLHGLWRMSRGKDLSMSFDGIMNPRRAFKAALGHIGSNIPSWWQRAKAYAVREDFFEALEVIEWIWDEARVWEHDAEPGECPKTIARIPLEFFGVHEWEVRALEQALRIEYAQWVIDRLQEQGRGDSLDFAEALWVVKQTGLPLKQFGTSRKELLALTRDGAEWELRLFLDMPLYGGGHPLIVKKAAVDALPDDRRSLVEKIIGTWKFQLVA
jgi:hypothetical protein